MYRACVANPIHATCPAVSSGANTPPNTPPIVPSMTGKHYQCVAGDRTNTDPTPSTCFCQCTCQIPTAAESVDAQDDLDPAGEVIGGAPAGPMTTVGPFFRLWAFCVAVFALLLPEEFARGGEFAPLSWSSGYGRLLRESALMVMSRWLLMRLHQRRRQLRR